MRGATAIFPGVLLLFAMSAWGQSPASASGQSKTSTLGSTSEQSPGVSAQELEKAKQSMACGSLQNSVGPWDYRTRYSTSRRVWDHNDNLKHHYQPAITSMQAGVYDEPVIRNLDFLLRAWPNHYDALRARIRYEEAGGRTHGYRSVECYLERARRFTPDDVVVLLIEADYYWKNKKNKQRATENYELALRLEPESVDVNYNAGLFYFAAGDLDKALEHARYAYSRGYPLPGLRRMLEEKGRWKDPEPASGELASAERAAEKR